MSKRNRLLKRKVEWPKNLEAIMKSLSWTEISWKKYWNVDNTMNRLEWLTILMQISILPSILVFSCQLFSSHSHNFWNSKSTPSTGKKEKRPKKSILKLIDELRMSSESWSRIKWWCSDKLVKYGKQNLWLCFIH